MALVQPAELELDVDELRCQLMIAREDALAMADEIADAVEQTRLGDDARSLIANYRQLRTTIRRLATAIRVEDGNR